MMTTATLCEKPQRNPWWPVRSYPVCWFLLVAVAVLLYCIHQGKMETDAAFNDTAHYLELSQQPTFAEPALRDSRTLAYPFFLKIVKWCGSPELATLPYWQFGISVIAVGIFFHGLRRMGVAPLWANLTAITLFMNLYALKFFDSVLTDSLGLSAVIAAFGFLLALLPGGEGVGRMRMLAYWVGLGFTVALGYHIRPIYQLMVPLVPFLGVTLLPVVISREKFWSRCWKLGSSLALLTVVPLLAFCGLRYFMVGNFGLVSFSGVALSGSASQLMTAEMIPDMPEDMQPLANEILRIRTNNELPTRLGRKKWESPYQDGKLDTEQFRLFFSPIIFNCTLSAALTVNDNDWVKADAELMRYNRHVIKERAELLPQLLYYLSKKAVRYAYGNFRASPMRKPVRYFLLGVYVLAIIRAVRLRSQTKKLSAHQQPVSWRTLLVEKFRWSNFRLLYLGALLPTAFLACNTLLILALLQSPLDRTVSPGMVFWPMAPLALAAWLWQMPTGKQAGEIQDAPEQANTDSKPVQSIKQAA